jgi:RNA polymerase sigma-54 factor
MSNGFSTKLFQSQQMRQEMRINPRLYQAMELLYMPLLDLQQHLKAELAENPFLEMSDADAQQEVELKEEADEKSDENEIDWEEILLEGFDAGGRKAEYEHKEYTAPTAVATEDLQGHLESQLHLLDLGERAMRLGEEIVGNIDPSGLLPCPLEVVVDGANDWIADVRDIAVTRAEELEDQEEREAELREIEALFSPYTVEEAELVLARIQTLEPPGVGARSVQECILIQMRQQGMDGTLPFRIVEEHFDDLMNHRWNDVARALGVGLREVQDAADGMSRFDPKPGRALSDDPEHYIIPDLIVEKIDGEYMVFANDTNLPRLRISRAYRDVARDRKNYKGENREFIAAKLNSANWMIQAIEQRRQTMLKVMSFIVDRQRAFFEKGVQHLRPLTLREVAEHIEMHESTVSRVTSRKYLHCHRGIFELKYFFNSSIETGDGASIASESVKDEIKKIIAGENPKKPFSDSAIVKLLKEQNISIARRTVAKYREMLGILPSNKRKQVF